MSERSSVITWQDPSIGLAAMPTMAGIDYLRAMLDGRLPGPPIADRMGFTLSEVEVGSAVFRCTPDESHANPIGAIHGGLVCTLLDSALGCAAQTTLPAGTGYTSIELKVNYLRPVRAGDELTCTGRVVKPGRRVVFAEGEVTDAAGRVVATASSSLLVMQVDAPVA
ncbi:PaaI family thioesterase [Agrococcus sp. ARC_14]|uniref:PaaI family thioesterase n=1 Tax=Agrococcus sp. ARC_14 TaxID=2919927 RepID=UPI001F064F41|nr:PaaI family thioesterase [Agrococcus sp. ARC_14]MCH1883187.1 PaaI family thioesterase [Agrococcus sp. ARC_14]